MTKVGDATYLYLSAFYDSCLQLFPGPVRVRTVGECHEAKSFRASFIEDNLDVQYWAEFLRREKQAFITTRLLRVLRRKSFWSKLDALYLTTIINLDSSSIQD